MKLAAVLGVGFALSAAGAMAQPTDLSEPAVAAWASQAGVDKGKLEFLAATSEGVFYIDPKPSVRVGDPPRFHVRLERFAATPGGTLSESATLIVDCGGWNSRVEAIKGFTGHNLDGRGTDAAAATWALLGTKDLGPIVRGNPLQRNRGTLCAAVAAERAQERQAEARAARVRARDNIGSRVRSRPVRQRR